MLVITVAFINHSEWRQTQRVNSRPDDDILLQSHLNKIQTREAHEGGKGGSERVSDCAGEKTKICLHLVVSALEKRDPFYFCHHDNTVS